MPKPKKRTVQFVLKILLRIVLVFIALCSLIVTLFGLFALIKYPDELYARTETKWLLFPDSRIEFYALNIQAIIDAIMLGVASCACLFANSTCKRLSIAISYGLYELISTILNLTYTFIATKSFSTNMLFYIAFPASILIFCLLWKNRVLNQSSS